MPHRRWLFRLAATLAGVIALVSVSWAIQSNFTDSPDFLFTLLAPYVGDKGNLNPVRLASFLALAFTVAQLVRLDSPLLATRPGKWLIACGAELAAHLLFRHSAGGARAICARAM